MNHNLTGSIKSKQKRRHKAIAGANSQDADRRIPALPQDYRCIVNVAAEQPAPHTIRTHKLQMICPQVILNGEYNMKTTATYLLTAY